MSIPAVCSACGHRFQAPDGFAGKRVKCKHCGNIFQIASASEALTAPTADIDAAPDRAALDNDALETLARLEGGADAPPPRGPGASQAGRGASGAGRIGPRLETRIPANPDAGDISLSGPVETFARANVLRYRYPGAQLVDQWLPILLTLGGLTWLGVVGADSRRDNPHDILWIKATRLGILVLLYWALIFPITLAMVRKAARIMRYRMPPAPRLRVFACYLVPFVLGTVLWIVGEGSVGGLILGSLFGLVLASILLWLLFRLRETEIPTSVGYGAGGFAIGCGVATLLLLGFNTLTLLGVTSAKVQAKVPTSPFGPGLAWVALPPESLPPMLKPKHVRGTAIDDQTTSAASAASASTGDNATPATHTIAGPTSRPGPASPVLSDLEPVILPGPIDSILQPLSTGSIIAVVRKEGEVGTTVTPFDLAAATTFGSPLTLASPLGAPVLSTDGQRLARIATWPRRAVWIDSTVTGKNLSKIDIDPLLLNPELWGFSSPTQIMMRGGFSGEGQHIELLDATQPHDRKVVKLPNLLGDGKATWAINPAARRLVLAAKLDVPTLVQVDLTTGEAVQPPIPINEIDPSLAASPTGLCYDANASHIAVLFEHAGSAVVLVYDAAKGSNTAEIDRPAPAGLIPGATHPSFNANALVSVGPNCWLAYGQGILDDATGNLVAQLMVDHVYDARMLDNDLIELLCNDPSAAPVELATLDRPKLEHLRHAPAASTAPPGP
jgi:hypothetical protein